jgi:hypothetical protein
MLPMRISGALTKTIPTLAALAVLAACADTPTAGPAEPSFNTASDTVLPPPDTIIYDAEQEYEDVARQVRGYAGHWYNEQGDLVVLLTDRTQASLAEQVIRSLTEPELAEGETRTGVTRIVDARYDFATLRNWRNAATFSVLAAPGAVAVDLDEARNRVAVWITDEGARAGVDAELRKAGVPVDGAIVEVSGAAEATNLQGFFNPKQSGYQIQSAAGRICTLGPPGLTGAPTYFTASHCTPLFWGNTGIGFFQHIVGGGFFIGNEVSDPPGWACGVWVCRWSDAALIGIAGGVPTANQVARTTWFAWHWAPGSINAVGVPAFNIVNPPLWTPKLRMVVDKVGRTTGWNRGVVTNTCVNMAAPPPAPPGRRVLCQFFITNMSRPGDSGAPVFRQLPFNRAQITGMLWGTVPGANLSIVSPRRGIRLDIGA